MSERSKYSRVYWRILQDDEFEGIRANEARVGAWTLMLLAADMAWPAPAYIPPVLTRKSVTALAEAGLIEPLSGGRFTLRGLDKERDLRKSAATRDPVGTQTGPRRDPDGRVDKTSNRQAETRRDEQDARDSLDTYHELTGWRPWNIWSGDKLRGAIGEYTDAKVDAALRAEYKAKPDRDTLLNRTLDRLAREAEQARRERKDKPRAAKAPIDNDELQRVRRELSVLPQKEAS